MTCLNLAEVNGSVEFLGLKNALIAAESWLVDGGHAESGSGRTVYLQIRAALASATILATAPSEEAVWEAAKAVRPLLFSDDESVAHRAASPESRDSVRKRLLDEARKQLAAA